MAFAHHHHHHHCHFLLLLFSLFLCHFNGDQSADPAGVFCNDNTKLGSGKTLANLDKLLVELVSKVANNGFIATSYGTGQHMVYGLAQCRADVSKEVCSTCIQDAAKQIRERCPQEADSRIWFDYCFLRYNKSDFIGEVDTAHGICYANVNNVTEPGFNKTLGVLTKKIRSQVVDPKNAGLGKGETQLSPFTTLYAFVQCTRDLSPLSCNQCLDTAVEIMLEYCYNKKGCRVFFSSCNIRYEFYPFFFPLRADPAFADDQIRVVYP